MEKVEVITRVLIGNHWWQNLPAKPASPSVYKNRALTNVSALSYAGKEPGKYRVSMTPESCPRAPHMGGRPFGPMSAKSPPEASIPTVTRPS